MWSEVTMAILELPTRIFLTLCNCYTVLRALSAMALYWGQYLDVDNGQRFRGGCSIALPVAMLNGNGFAAAKSRCCWGR
jgi:hypothetical protein